MKKNVSPLPAIILVGTKSDLKEDRQTLEELSRAGQAPISEEEGKQMAKEIGAVKYLECSAKLRKVSLMCILSSIKRLDLTLSHFLVSNQGVKNVFDEAIKAVLFPPVAPKKKPSCNIL